MYKFCVSLRHCHTMQFLLQLATQFYSYDMLITEECFICEDFTSLKSRMALQVARKIASTLILIIIIINLGSTLMCYRCAYLSSMPKAQQMCGNTTVNCSTDYCYSVKYNDSNGVVTVARDCDNPNYRACPDSEKTCETRTSRENLKSCAAACCTTDNCNNYTPSGATGVVLAKFTLCLMAIVGLFFV